MDACSFLLFFNRRNSSLVQHRARPARRFLREEKGQRPLWAPRVFFGTGDRRMVRPHQCATDWQAIHPVNTRWKALAHTYLYIPATFVYVRYVQSPHASCPVRTHPRVRGTANARMSAHGFLKMRWFNSGERFGHHNRGDGGAPGMV